MTSPNETAGTMEQRRGAARRGAWAEGLTVHFQHETSTYVKSMCRQWMKIKIQLQSLCWTIQHLILDGVVLVTGVSLSSTHHTPWIESMRDEILWSNGGCFLLKVPSRRHQI
ncbi:uncharacterized protein [Linepithema humile]|uniref:uncharacterized protein n=1 Tax=Linepithema humile TaxID=83485 RepID=UPI00351F4CB9